MKSRYLREQLRALPMVLAFLGLGALFMFTPKIAMAIIASILLLVALTIVIEDLLLSRRGCRVQGAVVDHQAKEGCFIPIVEFRDRNGTVNRMVTKTGSGVRKPAVGTRVAVIYDPAGKRGCEIDTFFPRWGFALAIAGLGSVFAIGAMSAK